jgi:hypothetical protein
VYSTRQAQVEGARGTRYSAFVAKETRKLRRAQEQKDSGAKDKRDLLKQPLVQKKGVPDPLGAGQVKALLLRLGLPLLAIWMIVGLVSSVIYSTTVKAVLLGIAALLTVAAAGLVVWVMRQAKKARSVASILRNADTEEGRKAALDQLDTSYKKNDPAALFAKAQLELQEDPKKALTTLERIDLGKVMAPVADEARAQRGMIHLMLGEVAAARQLVDGIDLSRNQEPRSRALMAAVCSEAWARSGVPKKAVETLALFDEDDPAFAELRPQLYRAAAYAYAHVGDAKSMRRVLKKMMAQEPRLLMGFMVKRTHPLLQKEAKKMIEQSGLVPRRMIVQRS